MDDDRVHAEWDDVMVHLLVCVRVVENELAAAADTGAEAVERGNGLLPGDAGVSDGLAVLEAGGAGRGDVLATLDEVGLEHDTHDHGGGLGVALELARDVLSDLELLDVLLRRVAVRAVDLCVLLV